MGLRSESYPDPAGIVTRIRYMEISRTPYVPGSHECCCGNPDCTDFEDRMKAWGIPLDELTTVTSEIPLGSRVDG